MLEKFLNNVLDAEMDGNLAEEKGNEEKKTQCKRLFKASTALSKLKFRETWIEPLTPEWSRNMSAPLQKAWSVKLLAYMLKARPPETSAALSKKRHSVCQIRNSFKSVACKNQKAFLVDLKYTKQRLLKKLKWNSKSLQRR
jgi:hypothetical protein